MAVHRGMRRLHSVVLPSTMHYFWKNSPLSATPIDSQPPTPTLPFESTKKELVTAHSNLRDPRALIASSSAIALSLWIATDDFRMTFDLWKVACTMNQSGRYGETLSSKTLGKSPEGFPTGNVDLGVRSAAFPNLRRETTHEVFLIPRC